MTPHPRIEDDIFEDMRRSSGFVTCPHCRCACRREMTDDGCPYGVLGGPRFWLVWTCDDCGWFSREEQE